MKKGQSDKNLQNGPARDWRAGIARTVLPVLLAALAMGEASAASRVFDQSAADGKDAFPSISAEQSADGFRLSTTTTVTGLTWWGSYSKDPKTLPADVFSVRIFADDGSGAPAATPIKTISQPSVRSPTKLFDVSGALVYRFDVALVPFTLDGGTNWYLSVINQFDVGDPNAAWFWSQSDSTGSDPTGKNFYRPVDGDPWSSDLSGNLAFQVSGSPGTAIPLPGSLLLILSGLAGLNLVGLRGRGRLAASPVEG